MKMINSNISDSFQYTPVVLNGTSFTCISNPKSKQYRHDINSQMSDSWIGDVIKGFDIAFSLKIFISNESQLEWPQLQANDH